MHKYGAALPNICELFAKGNLGSTQGLTREVIIVEIFTIYNTFTTEGLCVNLGTPCEYLSVQAFLCLHKLDHLMYMFHEAVA
jgi:hypothetical protein